MYIIYQIDENGFLVWESGMLVNEGEQLDGYISTPLPQGVSFYKPRWVNGEWIEGKTDEDFIEDEFLASLQPSQYELEKAERQLETIELLIELEVI
ncbi:hypothetical protein [Bacillus ndiopicus]|uniref:hypothetical protein n=1 Tax=Bacillus ndiopicus TaxID=1347368 RepID=UPI0005A772FA|nr:hypothetical protein [Bacillus ndiopicus]